MSAQSTGTVLLLHAGIADSGMWRPQIPVLQAAGYQVIAPDLRGFGKRRLDPAPFSHLRDVEVLLDGPVAVVGNSLGGRVALELALHRPDLAERLMLIAPGLPGWDWSAPTRASWAEEEAALDRGDFETAAEVSLRMWVDGPNRSPDEVDTGLRASVAAMVVRSYAMQQGAWEAGAREEELLGDPAGSLLGEIRCPTLVLIGGDDVGDMQAIAAHVANSITDARLLPVPNAAHLPSLERPDEVNALLLDFLGN
jgi:pimeloyl-ACP methyl ester carboxylesterase